ncbi:hypothetical protein [Streptomyces atratus]|uniref:hypothetical protein n=1 Tax=Streptomyces atratus TaxID=1893 RepID=UPI002251461D|nr:hypothetical protein [Streptomyces atratus]MCX5339366.1 hypothetical protein [Streptomyces atratus]
MLNGLLKLRTQYGYRLSVSEIVGSGAPHKQLMAACKKLGAQEVLGPGNAGHSRHVHCGWTR